MTLVELMVTLAVAIILLASGMPLFSSVVANNRIVSQTNAFVTSIQLARSEAVKRGETVTLCPQDGSGSSPPTCGSNTDWPSGWTIFFDDGATLDEHIRVVDAQGPQPIVTTASANIQFNSQGAGTSLHTFSVQQSDANSAGSRCITVSVAGQVTTNKYNPGAGETCP